MKEGKVMNITNYVVAHQQACECWEHGDMVESWIDENGDICIRYEDGKWWHYRISGKEIEWF